MIGQKTSGSDFLVRAGVVSIIMLAIIVLIGTAPRTLSQTPSENTDLKAVFEEARDVLRRAYIEAIIEGKSDDVLKEIYGEPNAINNVEIIKDLATVDDLSEFYRSRFGLSQIRPADQLPSVYQAEEMRKRWKILESTPRGPHVSSLSENIRATTDTSISGNIKRNFYNNWLIYLLSPIAVGIGVHLGLIFARSRQK